jgi:hypothetical protein
MLPNSFCSLFREKRITGNAITPFMLERVKELWRIFLGSQYPIILVA